MKSWKGVVALHCAAKSGNNITNQLLLAHGADDRALDNNLNAMLHYATQNHYNGKASIELYLNRNANIDQQNSAGETPLHTAAKYADIESNRFLLTHGAKPDILDNISKTALHKATKNRDHGDETVELYLSQDFDLEAKDSDGWTPLCHAVVSGNHHDILRLLSHGADMFVRTNEKLTFGQIAHQRLSKEKIKWISRTFCKEGGEFTEDEDEYLTDDDEYTT